MSEAFPSVDVDRLRQGLRDWLADDPDLGEDDLVEAMLLLRESYTLCDQLDSFEGLVRMVRALLDQRYPADLFGEGGMFDDGAVGPRFVAKLYEALQELEGTRFATHA